jgi:GxxExxY protein
MKSKPIETLYDELTYRIIGCAMAVHRQRGPGYREDTYQRDLEAQLAESKLSYQPQKLLEVYDSSRGHVLIGYYNP